ARMAPPTPPSGRGGLAVRWPTGRRRLEGACATSPGRYSWPPGSARLALTVPAGAWWRAGRTRWGLCVGVGSIAMRYFPFFLVAPLAAFLAAFAAPLVAFLANWPSRYPPRNRRAITSPV